MNTVVKHDKFDLVLYLGLGSSKALLLYPFWAFGDRGKAGWFGRFKLPRGVGVHVGLFGAHFISQPCRLRAVTETVDIKYPEEPLLPNFVDPPRREISE